MTETYTDLACIADARVDDWWASNNFGDIENRIYGTPTHQIWTFMKFKHYNTLPDGVWDAFVRAELILTASWVNFNDSVQFRLRLPVSGWSEMEITFNNCGVTVDNLYQNIIKTYEQYMTYTTQTVVMPLSKDDIINLQYGSLLDFFIFSNKYDAYFAMGFYDRSQTNPPIIRIYHESIGGFCGRNCGRNFGR